MEDRINQQAAHEQHFRIRRERTLSQLKKQQSKREVGRSISPLQNPKHSSEKKLEVAPAALHTRQPHEKTTTEPDALGIKFRTPRKLTEPQQSRAHLPSTDLKLSFVKKFSEDNPAYNLRKTYSRFHQRNPQSPPPRTKKFKDFSYKQRYYDINRRLLRNFRADSEQTNIYLSADAWVAFDYNEAKYIRGWKVQAVEPAQNLTKLLLVNTTLRVLSHMGLDPGLLRMQISVPAESKNHMLSRSLVLHDNTQIQFLELMYGLMVTSSLELYDHLMLGLGYLLYCSSQKSHDHGLIQGILSHMLVAMPKKHHQKEKLYLQACFSQMKRTILQLKMLCTQLSVTEHYQMLTCCIDLCILTVDSFKYPQFKPMFTAKTHTSPVRFQTGFNFSEERKIKWETLMPWDSSFIGVCSGFRENNGTRNNSMVAYHRDTDIIVVLLESRFQFRTDDATKVVEWCMRNMKNCRKKTYLEECRETFMLTPHRHD